MQTHSSRSTPRMEETWPGAVIAGAHRTGVLGARSLIRRNVRTVMFDCNPEQPGFESMYGPARMCPDPDHRPKEWLDFMIALAKEIGGKPALIASADQFVSAIASHADALSEHYLFSPAARIQGLLSFKLSQYELASAQGMPMPRTAVVRTESDLREFSESARFPCLIKPPHFRDWQRLPGSHPLSHEKIAVCGTRQELVDAWHSVARTSGYVIAQEIIEGPDSSKRVYVAYFDKRQVCMGQVVFRELRCDPPGFGSATVAEPVRDEETESLCGKFLAAIGYSGICEIEVKRDSRDGIIKLIEANPRLTGTGDAAPYAGLETCWIHYLDLIGSDIPAFDPEFRSFRHIVLRNDMAAIIKNWIAGTISWREVVYSYRGPRAFYDFECRNWRYSTDTLYRMVRSAVGAVLRGGRPDMRRSPSEGNSGGGPTS